MGDGEFRALRGTVISSDQAGLWLRLPAGQEARAEFQGAACHTRPDHQIALAGVESEIGFAAEVLVNHSTGETWHQQLYSRLSWGQAIRLVFKQHVWQFILMAIPLVNLAAGTVFGLGALVAAFRMSKFWRTLAIFAGWTIASAFILLALSGWRKDSLMIWYLVCYPFTFVFVVASLEKGVDESIGARQLQLQESLDRLGL
jgi:hypothetical protein